MKLEIEMDPAAIAEGIDKAIRGALTKAADDSLRYGSLGREIKAAADKAVVDLARAALADASFREPMCRALREGILAGLRARGEKVAKAMPLQQALDMVGLTPPAADNTKNGG